MQRALLVLLSVALGASPTTAKRQKHAELRAVSVKRPNIVVRGSYLRKVEIWAVPTGTAISPEGRLVGNAKRSNGAGQKETCLFPIACQSPLIPSTEIFAKAFDVKGSQVGRKSLPYSGTSENAQALCGE